MAAISKQHPAAIRRRPPLATLRRCGTGLLAAATLLAGTPARAQGSDVTPFTLSTVQGGGGGELATAQVNDGHGCKGGNKPPALQWSAPPAGTKGFAVTMLDLTAGNGAGFWHWALFDLAPGTRTLDPARLPDGAKAGRNGFGEAGYGGPCPPPGQAHQYRVTVWAVGEPTLSFDAGSSDGEIGDYLKAHALGHTDLTLRYKR